MNLDRLPLLTFPGLAIDRSAREVYVLGESQPLARVDFEMLVELARRPKIALSQRDLAALTCCSLGAVTEHIRRVRRVVGEASIATVRGIGYRWELRPIGNLSAVPNQSAAQGQAPDVQPATIDLRGFGSVHGEDAADTSSLPGGSPRPSTPISMGYAHAATRAAWNASA